MNFKTETNYWLQDISKKAILQGVLSGMILILLVVYLFYGSFLPAVFLSPYLIFHMKFWKQRQVQKAKQEFRLQFTEAIQAISASLQVGYSTENALKEAYVDLQLIYPKETRILKELRYMIRQMEMNITMEQIFREFAQRTQDAEVELFATVFALAKRTGGDMVEVIRNAVWQIGEKLEVKREIETMMAAKKMEFRIMSMVPFGMILYIKVSFPTFMEVLYGNVLGAIFMSVCLLLYAGAYEWGRRMMEVEV